MAEIVSIYLRVDLELLSQTEKPEQASYVIVPAAAADLAMGLLAETTPLARTILGRRVGEQLAYHQGDLYAVRILSVSPAPEVDLEEAARRRQEAAARDARGVAQKEAAAFAASFSGKWGDYDPDGVAKWEADQGGAAGGIGAGDEPHQKDQTPRDGGKEKTGRI